MNIIKKSTSSYDSSNQSSALLSLLQDEFVLLPVNTFLIESSQTPNRTERSQINDEYLSKTGLFLQCKLIDSSNPLIPQLRLRVSTRYPREQPEILSLTNSMPPKLDFAGK